ncbi:MULTISPECIES: host attachment protein [Inquilinus]|uniref:Protein required for attachment to host cells n=1 Tax=Inquilinus ginsengisoli TaxID=363840 RepID=A0ABU1JKS3_9PROT|nr:host attachment protein [Inquilinus ginsengisoli]MDR6288150.1 protein required for attachment to host cells [Inquilinus ginsengisoli]
MTAYRLPHDAWVVVCDATKALFLKNSGDQFFPDLRLVEQIEAPGTDRSSDLGTDRPGRLQNRSGPASAIEQTDWHRLEKQNFAMQIARKIDGLTRENPAQSVILVAPPRILGALRRALCPMASAAVVAEIGKDLTKHPVHEIERLLAAG